MQHDEMKLPFVSVVMPVYNGQRYLSAALKSVFEQQYPAFEVIVVDDGSVDASAAIATSFSGVRYIYQENQGVACARNAGISASKGEFVAFIDQDDLWLPNKLSVQMQYLIDNPEIEYVLANKQVFLEDGQSKPGWLKDAFLKDKTTGFLPGTLVARKYLFEKVGMFDPAYEASSDSDWFFRANDCGVKKAVMPKVLLLKRVHNSNQSYQTKTINDELLKIAISSIKQKRQQHGRE
ncbi:MAG TPA: glycosyltransferase family A protein [Patescibacteria group bacterium]|nr:glycosyltransferase family A protein [Patescibacteria group bacterium]